MDRTEQVRLPRRPYQVTFTKLTLKQSVKLLLNNWFFKFGNKVFQQVIGILMGSDPALLFESFFLYYYENKWINEI